MAQTGFTVTLEAERPHLAEWQERGWSAGPTSGQPELRSYVTSHPDGDLPPYTLRSDVDAMRYVIVDPADADMSGWTLELMDENIRWEDPNALKSLSSFHQDTWFSTGEGQWNGLGYGTPKTAWCAIAAHGDKIRAWIGPDGTVHHA